MGDNLRAPRDSDVVFGMLGAVAVQLQDAVVLVVATYFTAVLFGFLYWIWTRDGGREWSRMVRRRHGMAGAARKHGFTALRVERFDGLAPTGQFLEEPEPGLERESPPAQNGAAYESTQRVSLGSAEARRLLVLLLLLLLLLLV